MNGNYIIQYAKWLNGCKEPFATGEFLWNREHEVANKKMRLRYVESSISTSYYVFHRNKRLFSFSAKRFKRFMMSQSKRIIFNNQISSILGTKENKMTRITWKNTVGGAWTNNKPVVLNGEYLTVLIESNFTYNILSNKGVSLLAGEAKTLSSAKKSVKADLIKLGVVFGSEVRTRKVAEQQAA